MEQSDFMLQTNISDLQFKDRRTNDLSFIYQMSQPQSRCLIDRGNELKFFKDQYLNKTPFCNDCTDNRGGNATKCAKDRSCPHPSYVRFFMRDDYLIVPCPKPTYKNYVTCNEEKCCSRNHQLFKNWTKRKIITPQT
jgi:hypothetical protein